MAVQQVRAASEGSAALRGRGRPSGQALRAPRAAARHRAADLAERAERDHLLDRLTHLRTIVPVFAQELASARRTAAQLRAENRRLLERIRELQHKSRHGR